MSVDARCAEFGRKIADHINDLEVDKKAYEPVVRNALGVLRTDSLYALYLYLQYQSKRQETQNPNQEENTQRNKGGNLIWQEIKSLLAHDEIKLIDTTTVGDDSQKVIKLTDDLNSVLLARQLIGQTLVYALYGLRGK